MELWIAVHSHEYGVDAKLFYIPWEKEIPDDEVVAQQLGFDVDWSCESVIINPVDNVSEDTPQLAGIPVISN